MRARTGPVGVAVAALLALVACGDGGEERVKVETPPTTASPATSEGNGIHLSVDWEPEELAADAAATFRLTVTNVSEAVIEIERTSAQRGEVVLLRGEDEVYRWSQGRVFTQALSASTLGPGEVEQVALEEPTLSVPPGRYRLIAELLGAPAPPPVETAVEVVESGAEG